MWSTAFLRVAAIAQSLAPEMLSPEVVAEGLGKGGVAAQIVEYDGDVAAMTFEHLVALRDDQFDELRREKRFKRPTCPRSSTCSSSVRWRNSSSSRTFPIAITALCREVLHNSVNDRTSWR